MILSDISVKRPVFASVLALLLVVFGAIAFDRLPLREYPDIDPPVVTVEVNYPGAPASVVETRVTQLLEDRVAGVEGIEFISANSADGRANVTVQFSINRDVDAAANDIRDRIAGIQDNLPEEAEPPEVQKADSNDDVIIWQNLTSDRLTVPELTDYARRFLQDQYAALDGVARVRVGGGQNYALRIWLDPQELAARNLTVADVEAALRAENVELPAGSLAGDARILKARVNRNFNTPADFETLVLAQGADGYLVRLGEVARVELGLEEDRLFFRGNGIPMVGIGVVKQSTANTIDVARAVKALTAKLNPTLPAGMFIAQSYDAAIFIEAAIQEVYSTLLVALLCVVAVIYLFLGSLRGMLIPAVTVPVSLIATFSVVYALGYSLNLLTLLALVLAIGLVVDDAIVVLENVVRRMKEHGESPLVAAFLGTRQVSFAVIATTLVLLAVFIPLTLLEGDIGRLFTEFAVTIAAAVVFSSLIALTLTPMLASQILHNRAKKAGDTVATRAVALSMQWLQQRYLALLQRMLRVPGWVLLGFVLLSGGTYILFQQVPQEFTPPEDRGAFFIFVSAPEGSTYDYIAQYMTEIERRLLPYTEDGTFQRLLVRAPRGFGRIENFNGGIVIVLLDDWANRKPAQELMAQVREKLAPLPGVRAFPVMRQGIGGGNSKPVQFVLGGGTYAELAAWRDILLAKIAAENPNLVGVESDYKETRPQLDIAVDYARAADLGVRIADIGQTLETMLGGRVITTYLDRGEEYDVIVEGERSTQRNLTDLAQIYIRSERTGALIPLSNLVQLETVAAPETLNRYNRVRAITLEANLADGYTLGAALDYLNQLVASELPEGVVVAYRGTSREYVNAGGSVLFVFVMGLLVVFLVLAAQFESYRHPLIIMLTVPLAVGGGVLGLWLAGSTLNIYSQIGLIILVGLAAKNGILIVEFANQLRDEGQAFHNALVQACATRFRPILMTSLTTFAGCIPLILSSGAGAETRATIGVVILAGITASVLLTLLLIPVAYAVLARGTSSPLAVTRRLHSELSGELPGAPPGALPEELPQ